MCMLWYFFSLIWGPWPVHNCTLEGLIHTHTHTLRTTTAMHPCPNTLTPTFLRLSLGFLHQTAHQVYFLHCGISPLLLSHKSSALPLKGKMTTSSHYNPTRSPFLFHPLCMPPISLHFLHYPSNKTLFYALLFASFRFPALSSSLLQLSFTSLWRQFIH